MSSNRHLGRIIALQTLYEHEFRTRSGIEGLTSDSNEILDRNLAVYKDTLSDSEFTRDLVEGALKHYDDADGLIGPAAPEWPIDQIATMDLTILRLALYELAFKREVPPKVVINEAVELAKSFGGENSSKFINGVLGTIYRQSEYYDPTEDHKLRRERGEDVPDSDESSDDTVQESTPTEQAHRPAASEGTEQQIDEGANESADSSVDPEVDEPNDSSEPLEETESE